MKAAPEKLTSRDICDALHRRYNKPSQGRDGEQYICIEEARAGAGFNGNSGRCDLLAINTWQSRGMELIGHEIKVSLSDWRAELAQQDKAERFARYCRRWYVAVPAELAAKIKDEVPPVWGLLSVSAKGRCTEVIAAPRRDPEPVPDWWWIGWMAQIDRQHKRGAAAAAERLFAAERENLRAQVERTVATKQRGAKERHDKLMENVAAFKEATGIDLQYVYRFDLDELAKAWSLVRSGFKAEVLARQLRKAAEALDAVSEEVSAAS